MRAPQSLNRCSQSSLGRQWHDRSESGGRLQAGLICLPKSGLCSGRTVRLASGDLGRVALLLFICTLFSKFLPLCRLVSLFLDRDLSWSTSAVSSNPWQWPQRLQSCSPLISRPTSPRHFFCGQINCFQLDVESHPPKGNRFEPPSRTQG